MTFAEFANCRTGSIRGMLRQLTRSVEVAEDLSQNVLLKCSAYFQERGSPPPARFVWRVAEREYYSWRRKKTPSNLPDGFGFDEMPGEENPTNDCEQQERAVVVWAAIESLPPLEKDLVKLHYFNGWRLRQIAVEKDLSTGAVKARIHRARSLLKQMLKRLHPN